MSLSAYKHTKQNVKPGSRTVTMKIVIERDMYGGKKKGYVAYACLIGHRKVRYTYHSPSGYQLPSGSCMHGAGPGPTQAMSKALYYFSKHILKNR